MRFLTRLLPLSLLLAAGAQAAPIKIEFWHAMDGVQGKVAEYARDFNRSQSQYEIVPVSKGNYRELLTAYQAAYREGKAPALVQLELTQIGALAAQGQLADLSKATDAIGGQLLGDLYPAAWKVGEVGGKRYALPWNISVPVLMYNARTVSKPPATWADLEAQSRKLAAGGKRPLVAAADAWTFEANVLSRGGSLVRGNEPNLNGPDAVEALTQLARMSQSGLAQPRGLNEAVKAAFDFARGQNTFVLASVANWTDARKLPFFSLGIAPFPCEKVGRCTVPLGGGALAVSRSATPQEQAGGVAFWQFLMDPARLADWIKTTAYAPPRKAALPLLNDWYAKNPQIRAAHAQMDRAVPRPTNPEYAAWNTYLEEAIRKATNGQATAQAALDEAQKRAQR